jgi:Fe2+-dicitrate sensor, membrane component
MKTGSKENKKPGGDLSRQASAWLVQLEDTPEDDAMRAEFMDWLATSPAHLAAWEETARVSDLIAVAGPLPQNMTVLPEGSSKPAWFRTTRPVRVLASLAMAACVAWIAVPYISLQLQADTITGTGELRQVRLDDGSVVQLAPDTAITFSNHAAGRRLKLLRGEAWFDVAHDKAHPFKVFAGDNTVTVLGTAFSVRKTDSGTDVAVERGRVAVTASDGMRSDRVELVAGQSVSTDGTVVTRGTVRPDRVASWRDGIAIVNDLPVGDMIDQLRPWYKGYIIARGPGLSDRHVSGIYDLRDPDLALKALAEAHKVTVSRVSPWLRIVTVR